MSELRFRSRSEHSLDSKGRLNIPSRFREVLREVYTESLVVTNWNKSLKAYPVEEWEKLEEKLIKEGKTKPGLGDFIRYVISGVTECQLDKQGRILLPASLRNEFNMGKDIIINGLFDHFEIWDKNDWQDETGRTRRNFANYEPDLTSMGIL